MEVIAHNFTEDSAFIQISGNNPDILYDVIFYDSTSDQVVYSTTLTQGCWAKTSKKATNIKVYEKDGNIIYDKYYNIDNSMSFNETSISYMGNLTPKELLFDVKSNIKNPFAIISPHAGYYFSGKVAAKSFSVIDKDKNYSNIFILSTSHTSVYNGASLCSNEYYNTPFGRMTINNELCDTLSQNEIFNFNNDHFINDHTINMVLPFIQERIKPDYNIVPIMIGDSDINNLKDISNILKPYLNENNLFIISSDFSHYPSYSDAIIIDNETKDAILSNNSEVFLKVINNNNKNNLSTRMCGWSSYLVLLFMIENKDIIINVEDYKNSGDIIYDKNYESVVGYYAINFCNKEHTLSIEDKNMLINIVKESIKQKLENDIIYEPETPESDILNYNRGAFVTLSLDNNLKGCIGQFTPNYPLYKVVRDMSLSSAFNDSRFDPVNINDLEKLQIEISVLSPFKKISDINDIVLGKHGIYISKDIYSGTFLPQVAEQTGWNLEEFLGHCAQDKAGIGWDGWKDSNIYIYEADVFNENDLKTINMKESQYYNKLDYGIVECVLCPHNCKIKENKYGFCLSRKNINGKLYATSYNNLSCVAIDPIEKKPFRNFMRGTKTYSISSGGCNFKCLNCQNYGISQEKPEDVTYYKMTPQQVVDNAISNDCPSISYTYTEPSTYYEMMIDTAKLANKAGLKNLMISNGYINEKPLKELCKYIDAFNIDLKSFSNEIYKKLNKGTLEPVLNTLKIIKENNKWLEITFLVIPNWTDDLNMVREMFKWLNSNGFSECPIHFIRSFPTHKLMDIPHASNEIIQECVKIATECGMKNLIF
jgi:MEMO1 family protein